MWQRTSVTSFILWFIGEFILEENHINVIYVAKPLVKMHTLQFIREFILERNHINVIFVAGALLRMQTLEVIRELILERNLTNVTCDKAFSQISGLLIHQRTHTREKSYKYISVAKLSLHIRQNHINVI